MRWDALTVLEAGVQIVYGFHFFFTSFISFVIHARIYSWPCDCQSSIATGTATTAGNSMVRPALTSQEPAALGMREVGSRV
jgi:hypothetical protein